MNGLHILANLTNCNFDFAKEDSLLTTITQYITLSGLSVVSSCSYKFTPQGLTFVILLAESHLSVHTWPELKSVAFDLYVCNHTKDNSKSALEVYEMVKTLFNPKEINQQIIKRGEIG